MQLNIKNTFQLFLLFTRPVPAWAAVLISRNHSITRLISFQKSDPIQRSLFNWLRAPKPGRSPPLHKLYWVSVLYIFYNSTYRNRTTDSMVYFFYNPHEKNWGKRYSGNVKVCNIGGPPAAQHIHDPGRPPAQHSHDPGGAAWTALQPVRHVVHCEPCRRQLLHAETEIHSFGSWTKDL